VTALAVDAPATGVDRRGILTLSSGHACVDVAQGAVAAMIPFLIVQRGYSYAAAGALLFAMTASSSLLQPLFGYLADRRSLPWLLPGGVLLAGTGIAAAGLVRSYPIVFAAILVSGLGVGVYHPEGARWANYVSGERRASGMSLYSVGGNIGFALGPILVTPLVLAFGLEGVGWLLVPGAAAALLLMRELPRITGFHPDRHEHAGRVGAAAAPDRWGPFARIASIAGVRSGAYFGMQAFVPVYFVKHYGASTGVGNAALTTVLVSGAIGTLVGGRVADRIGKRRILVGCNVLLTPLLLGVALLSIEPLAFVLLALTGFFTVGTFAITVVLGQTFLPNRIGVASGVTLGAAIGVGGVVAALLGVLADAVGLMPVMFVIAALPLPALALSLGLPRDPAAALPADRRRV
jgi:FSR family fosmidomycin resistance protein-like MFS transporter